MLFRRHHIHHGPLRPVIERRQIGLPSNRGELFQARGELRVERLREICFSKPLAGPPADVFPDVVVWEAGA